jgi:hypothetical protein
MKTNQGLHLRATDDSCLRLNPVKVVGGDPCEECVGASLATFNHRTEANQRIFHGQRTTAITLKNKIYVKFEHI